jgi:hypothetical protein
MDAAGFDIALLDTADPGQVTAYERALFRAFSSVITGTTDPVFLIDWRARRLRTRLSYASQEILVVRKADAILAGTAINFDLVNTLQLEMLGFSIDKAQPGVCEALALFSLLDPLSSAAVLKKVFAILLQRFADKGIRRIYGTCSQRRLRSYQIIGFATTDQTVVQGQAEYLLELGLDEPAIAAMLR